MNRGKDLRVSILTSAPSNVDGNKMVCRRVRDPEPLVIDEVEHDFLPFLWLKE